MLCFVATVDHSLLVPDVSVPPGVAVPAIADEVICVVAGTVDGSDVAVLVTAVAVRETGIVAIAVIDAAAVGVGVVSPTVRAGVAVTVGVLQPVTGVDVPGEGAGVCDAVARGVNVPVGVNAPTVAVAGVLCPDGFAVAHAT